MKVQKIIKYKGQKLLLAAAVLASALASCDDSDGFNTAGSASSVMVTVKAVPCGWGDASTRSTYSNMTEASGNKIFPMEFQRGDAIGVYIVDSSGSVIVANHRYTYTGTAWNTRNAIEYEAGMGSYSFFAYYPYQESLSGSYSVGDNAGASATVADFFSDAMTAWTVAADQSALADFTGSDFMTAAGTATMSGIGQLEVTFSLMHRMGLLVTKSSLSFYDESDPSDTWSVAQTFTDNVPYAIGEELYYIVKPGEEVTLGSKTATVASGQVEQLYFPDGEPSSR